MSELPKIALSHLCDKITDGTHHSPPNFPHGQFKYITAKNIKPWGLDLNNLTYVDEATHREIYARCDVRKDDVLYIKDGATTGTAVLNPLDEQFSLLSSVGVLRPGPAVRPKYLLYALQDPRTKAEMMEGVAGVAITRLTLKKLGAAEIPVAPLATQDRIVEKLEELLSGLDAGVAELKAAQRKLARYRQSLLKAAVQGELTAAWRARHPPQETGAQLLARILAERRTRWEARQLAKFAQQGKAPPKDWRQKYPEPVRPDTTGLPALPQGWVWSSLGECFDVAVGATPSRKEPGYWNGSIPWVSSGEVRFSRIRETKETISEAGLNNSSTQINPAGSVLLGMIGEGKTRGQVAILDVPAANNQNCAAIWVGETLVAPEYVYYWLWSRYEQTRRGSSGNNQPALNKSIVERITLPLPPLAEVSEIVRTVESVLAEIAQQEAAVEHALRQSTAQRQNLLRAAFSGQLVPQNPADEPASALLA
ncbi:MAG TPA: restriction endonuclease subunit S, partial [Alicycliphilus sp.]|nr:restriction endonuclease subunit S [Alicycliphilus sp.]